MQAGVLRLSMTHPGDASALEGLVRDGRVRAREIVAVIGKAGGSGGVADFVLSCCTQGPMAPLRRHLDEPADTRANPDGGDPIAVMAERPDPSRSAACAS
jgi:cyanuric acid amidohydrolase